MTDVSETYNSANPLQKYRIYESNQAAETIGR
jgi:hypothetical protein